AHLRVDTHQALARRGPENAVRVQSESVYFGSRVAAPSRRRRDLPTIEHEEPIAGADPEPTVPAFAKSACLRKARRPQEKRHDPVSDADDHGIPTAKPNRAGVVRIRAVRWKATAEVQCAITVHTERAILRGEPQHASAVPRESEHALIGN